MDLNITQQKKNDLLQRLEISGTLTFSGATPSKTQVQEQLSQHLHLPAEHLVLRSVHTAYGNQQASFSAVAYDSAEAKKKFEIVPSHLKKKEKQAAAPAAKEAKK